MVKKKPESQIILESFITWLGEEKNCFDEAWEANEILGQLVEKTLNYSELVLLFLENLFENKKTELLTLFNKKVGINIFIDKGIMNNRFVGWCINGDVFWAQWYLKEFDLESNDGLYNAAFFGNLEIVKLIVEANKFYVTTKENYYSINELTQAIIFAEKKNNTEIARYLKTKII